MNPKDPYDLQRIEIEARRLRAEAMRETFFALATWARRLVTRQPAARSA